MSESQSRHATLPETGYVRQTHIIGEPEVTAEQAQANRERGRGPKRPRPATPGVFPVSSATLWRKVASNEFPKPIKLSERVTAWRVEDIRCWIEARSAA